MWMGKVAHAGFNGLLIGQGIARVTMLLLAPMLRVSMASSSAKALQGILSIYWWLLEQVSMASSSAKALQARAKRRGEAERKAFQWPPHRPRHCKLGLRATTVNDLAGFNGLLIGQGIARLVSRFLSGELVPFQWPPHRPRHCKPPVAGGRNHAHTVSMASSSAKALQGTLREVP